MSASYVAVNWNRQKRIYDALVAVGVLASVGIFAGVTALAHPTATVETMVIRGLGLTGFLLLHLILMIGPMARLDPRFLPLLYNRRHLGVTLGLLAVAHAGFATFQYHALGNVDPLVSLVASNRDWASLANFPFELFGIVALAILFLMAATSHDYWLSVLTPPAWKRLHMLVYVAYVALVAHVGLGFLQDERHPVYLGLIGLGVVAVGGLHLAAAARERSADRLPNVEPEWVDIAAAAEIVEGRAKIGLVGTERVAVFRHQNRLSAVSNVCRHQNGPLGEGRIIDGCITCPWHGYQYRPDTGISPPPFDDRIATYHLRVDRGRVLVHRVANAPGTRVEPVADDIATSQTAPLVPAFYVGYQPFAPAGLARFTTAAGVTILLLGVGVMATFALAQRTFQPAGFDFGRPTIVEGTIRLSPYPVLEVEPAGGAERISRYLLAATGKHGAQSLAAPSEGQRVRLTGFLAYRDRLRLLEVATIDDVADSAGETAADTTAIDLGTHRLEGEIVDSKCYTGVMNPGLGKTHRGCAARCLSGGLTPLLVTKNAAGQTLELIVVNDAIQPLAGIDAMAGKPVSLTGRVWRRDDLWFLQVGSP